MNPKKNSILVALCAFVVCASCAEDFPSTIPRCKVEDEECIVKSFNAMQALAEKSGIPELGIPMSDKHFIKRQDISMGSNLMTLNMTFSNVTLLGLAKNIVHSVKGFKKDPKQMEKVEISGIYPFLDISGKYVASGKFLLIQINGGGNAALEFHNSTYKITVFFKTETRGGEEYAIPSKVRTEYKSERIHFNFENFVNNKEINDGINSMANENHELFGKEINRSVRKSFSELYKEMISPLFGKFPYRFFFL